MTDCVTPTDKAVGRLSDLKDALIILNADAAFLSTIDDAIEALDLLSAIRRLASTAPSRRERAVLDAIADLVGDE